MARPLRIEFPGAVYHVTSRGNAQAAIFVDDVGRNTFLAVLRQTFTLGLRDTAPPFASLKTTLGRLTHLVKL